MHVYTMDFVSFSTQYEYFEIDIIEAYSFIHSLWNEVFHFSLYKHTFLLSGFFHALFFM